MTSGSTDRAATILRDADPEMIRARRIAIIGYGNQGRAHALNLRDSGAMAHIALRDGSPNSDVARADGFAVGSIANCARWADLVALLLPDQVHAVVFAESIAPHLHPGDALLVAHGFSVHFGQIVPPPGVDVILVAPVGPGSMVRRLFEQGSGVPGLIAAAPGAGAGAEDIALSYAAALGCTRVGVLRTSFEEETITDLFGEQAVLCGGIPALINAAYDTLVEAGYQPELAYFECVHQVKLIVDLIYESGIAGMRVAISDTARFGAYDAAPRVVNDGVRSALRALLSDIQRGEFARAWLAEAAAGMGEMRRRQEQEANLPIEDVGHRLRNLT